MTADEESETGIKSLKLGPRSWKVYIRRNDGISSF